MEIIAKILKAFFMNENDEVNMTLVQQVKKALLWILLGAILMFGALLYFVDDEEIEETNTEYVEDK